MTRPGPQPTVRVAGHTVTATAGRVWLHPDHDADGDLSPQAALALATALRAAAQQAIRQHTRRGGGDGP